MGFDWKDLLTTIAAAILSWFVGRRAGTTAARRALRSEAPDGEAKA